MNRLLVVTPTLGTSPYLKEALDSVSSPGMKLQHVIVAPQSMLRSLGHLGDGYTLVGEKTRGGIYAAINTGVAAAEPWDWFTYLNDDDLVGPGFATVVRRHIASLDENVIAYGDVRWIDATGASLGLMPVERNAAHFEHLISQSLVPLTQQGTLTSRAVYERLAGFDHRYRLAADLDFWLRAHRAGVRFRYYAAEVGQWRIHREQASMSRREANHEAGVLSSRLDVKIPLGRRYWENFRFRAVNCGRYVDRFRRTGALTSAGVFEYARGVSRRQ